MTPQTGGTGNTPARGLGPVVGSATHAPVAGSRPLLGYLRVSPLMDDDEVERLRRELAAYATDNGFALQRVLVDRNREHTAAFAELIHALWHGEAAHAVVPALHHLAHFPGVQLAMKELLEVQTGAQLHVLHPTEEPA